MCVCVHYAIKEVTYCGVICCDINQDLGGTSTTHIPVAIPYTANQVGLQEKSHQWTLSIWIIFTWSISSDFQNHAQKYILVWEEISFRYTQYDKHLVYMINSIWRVQVIE